jgi:hypothetical protein
MRFQGGARTRSQAQNRCFGSFSCQTKGSALSGLKLDRRDVVAGGSEVGNLKLFQVLMGVWTRPGGGAVSGEKIQKMKGKMVAKRGKSQVRDLVDSGVSC